MIRGTAPHVFICDACVVLCSGLVDQQAVGEARETKKKGPSDKPTPKKIYEHLNEYVIGQEQAKKILAVSVYNHYKRIGKTTKTEIGKSNVLLIGPTGSGKTYLAQTIAKYLQVPFAHADATSMTEAGYVGEDVESVLVRLYQNAEGDVARTERGIAFIDECFPPTTEILTESGFVRLDRLEPGQKVFQYLANGTMELVAPERIVKNHFSGHLFDIKAGFGRHISTPNHQRVVINTRGETVKKSVADSLVSNHLVPVAGIYSGPGAALSDDEIRFMIAFSADGCVKNKRYGYISVKKDRKVRRLDALLASLGMDHTKSAASKGYTSYYFGNQIAKYFPSLTRDGKKHDKMLPRSWMLNLNASQRKVFIEELKFWDGHDTGGCFQYFSSNLEEAELVRDIAATSGCAVSITARKKDGYRDNYAVTMQNKANKTQSNMEIKAHAYDGDVYCVTVPSGMIMIKEGGDIQITGNCDKLASRGTSGRDVSGEGVQQGLLKMLEGSVIAIKPNGRRSDSPNVLINTKDILFIVGGAFSDLTDEQNQAPTLGFHQEAPEERPPLKHKDLVKFGMLPEFIGRFPLLAPLEALKTKDLVTILTEPKNSLVRQYEEMFAIDGIKLKFDSAFLEEVARRAQSEGTGARALRSVMEPVLMDLMFHAPDMAADDILVTAAMLPELKK
jgi:ATP-dependent protease Clp ATPase subunit